MGFHKRGDEELSVQEDNCRNTILAQRSASVCQLEIEIERELESHDRERKLTNCTEPEYTCTKPMSVSLVNRNLPSNEKPTVI